MSRKASSPYNGEAPHLELILSQIKSKEGGLRVAIGISSQDILKKSVTIPVLPPDEVREALNWSTSKTIPTSLDEMYYDYMMLGEVEERGIRKQEACFVGAQKAFVNSLLTSFANSGFRGRYVPYGYRARLPGGGGQGQGRIYGSDRCRRHADGGIHLRRHGPSGLCGRY